MGVSLGYHSKNTLAILLIILNFLIINTTLNAQESTIDSISRELYSRTDYENILRDISHKSVYADSLNEEYIELGLKYSNEKNLTTWIATFTIDKSHVYMNEDQPDLSISTALEAMEMIDQHSLPNKLKGRGHFILSHSLSKIGAYSEAIIHLRRQLSLVKNKKEAETRWIITGIGGNYYVQGKYDSAIVYFKLAYKNYKDSVNLEAQASMMNNIALAYLKNKQLDSAKLYFNVSREILLKDSTKNDGKMLALVSLNLSNCYPLNRNGKKRIEKLTSYAIEISKRENLRPIFIQCLFTQS